MDIMHVSPLAANELCLTAVSFFNLAIGALVLTTQPRKTVNRTFALVALGIFVWSLGLVLLSWTHHFMVWNTVIMYGFTILLYGLVLFARTFPETPTRLSATFCVWTAVPLVSVIVLAPLGLIVRGGVFHPGTNPEPVNGPFYFVLLILSAAYVGTSVYLFIRTFRRARGHERDQMRYFIFGLSTFAVFAFLFDILLPSMGIYGFNFLGPMSSVILTGATAYAIVRHRLLDIRIVIQRGLIYTSLFVLIALTYATTLQLASLVLRDFTQMNAIVAGVLTTTAGIFFFRPLESYFRKVTDPIFFKNPYDYARALHDLNSMLYTSLSREEIIEHSEHVLREIFKTDDVRFILDPAAAENIPETHRSSGYATLLYPIAFEDTTIGMLHLGPKRSGETYTKQDLQLVSTFAFPAAIALGKARLHDEVRKYSSHLEELVDERTREIKKLQEEQKRHMIDISHNLQTPLAVIKGELELLGDNFADQEKVQVVGASLDRVSGFIRQLLRIARLENESNAVEFLPLDLAALLAEQADYFEPIAEDKGADLAANIPEGPVVVRGNRRLLGELFTNLVANALTYSEPSRKTQISISLSVRPDTKSAVVSIRDNGIGIAPEDMPALFDRFYRSPRIAHALSGSGLGLAIAKQITDMHGGTISAESTLGEGTTFTVTLPLG